MGGRLQTAQLGTAESLLGVPRDGLVPTSSCNRADSDDWIELRLAIGAERHDKVFWVIQRCCDGFDNHLVKYNIDTRASFRNLSYNVFSFVIISSLLFFDNQYQQQTTLGCHLSDAG